MLKIRMICFLGLLFLSSCHLLSIQVISKEEYMRVVDGAFWSIDDVMKIFPMGVADIKKRVDFAFEVAKGDIDEILAIKDSDRTFNNTARAYDLASSRFYITWSVIHNMELVHPVKDIRDLARSVVVEMGKFSVDNFLRVDIYKAFKYYVENNSKSENLDREERYFLDESIKGFERSGLHLEGDKLLKVKNIQKKLAELSCEFAKNIANDKSFVLASKDDLVGMEEDFFAGLEKDDKDGSVTYKLKMDYPTVFSVLKHCKNGDIRRKIRSTFDNRAYPENNSVLRDVISLRHELAKLLGFKSFAHYNLDKQMAKTLETVKSFLGDLAEKVHEKAEKEFRVVFDDLPEGVVLDNGRLKYFDSLFAKESYKKKNFNLDDREVSKYFVMENTIQGIFDIYQKFLNLEFKLLKPSGLWHKDVFVIEIFKKGENSPDGYLFMDLYPRDGKYTHACCTSMVSPSFATDGAIKPSVTGIIANFPKSTATKPSLLKHDDVTTFFHEFGHAMHNLLGRTKMVSFAGYETKRDFVEVPSQMFEEWMWDKKMLKNISSHYETGDSLPDNLIDSMIKLKNAFMGYWVQRQVGLSKFSLWCFDESENKDIDTINSMEKKLFHDSVSNIVLDPGSHHYCSFGHLMGYSASYYSYLYSIVMSLDFFYKIKTGVDGGLLDGEMGELIIDKVLSKGGSVEPDVLVEAFLGRPANQEAFLKDIGV